MANKTGDMICTGDMHYVYHEKMEATWHELKVPIQFATNTVQSPYAYVAPEEGMKASGYITFEEEED